MKFMPLIIKLFEDGRLTVEGPMIENKILCYGLLQAATDFVKEHKSDESRITLPPPGLKL